MLPRCSLALASAGRLPSFAACGPTLSLHPQTPRGTAEFLSSTGGGVCLPPALGPERPAARTELRGAQLRPLACHVGWEEGQDLPRPSQTVSSHNYPVSTSATLAQASRVLPRPSTQPDCLAAGPAAEQDVWGSNEGERPIVCSLYCPLGPRFSLQGGLRSHLYHPKSERLSPSPRGVLLKACEQLSTNKASPSASR